ncbi:hypothetical protein VTJ49DRAFT_1860 [Mycothermus thermophilus]|uniref:Uncharacterized protein n=1 Tax=Humicola insolens TaxID=85995 RepID=A0ABR3VBK7_HUMIN
MSLFPEWLFRSVRRDTIAHSPILAIERLNSQPRPLPEEDKEVLVGAVLTMSASLNLALSMLQELLPQEQSRERLGEVLSNTVDIWNEHGICIGCSRSGHAPDLRSWSKEPSFKQTPIHNSSELPPHAHSFISGCPFTMVVIGKTTVTTASSCPTREISAGEGQPCD